MRGEIITVEIDFTKNVFGVHGVDETAEPVLVGPEVPRSKLLELIANPPPFLIGKDACAGARHFLRCNITADRKFEQEGIH